MPLEDIPQAMEYVEQRIMRYPPVIRYAYPIVAAFFIFLGPLFLLGRLCRATSLDTPSFAHLLNRAYGHRLVLFRAFFMLVQMPLIEALTRENTPQPIAHPLAPFLSRQATVDHNHDFDVIIIGSGAGGAPLAWDLSRRGLRVALVEKGRLPTPQSGAGALEHFYISQGMTLSVTKGLTLVVAGSTIGGTTSINSGTCLRPLVECLQQWDEKCGTSFSDGSLDPWLDRVETKLGVYQPPRHLMSISSTLFERGLEALDREGVYILPRNAPQCEGEGRCCFVCPAGAKLGSDRAFLPEALAANTRLIVGQATHIVENNEDVSVEVKIDGERCTFRGKHLVLAAGALSTPRLIRKNRLGTRWRTAGNHLRIHPAGKVLAHFPDLEDDKRGVPQGLGYRPPGLPRLTLEGIHVPKSILGTTISKTGAELAWWLRESRRVASFGMFVRDRGSGSIRNWGELPVIHYRTHPEDVRDLAVGCRLIAEAFFAAGADRVLLPIVGKPAEFTSMQALAKIRPEDFKARDFIISGFHPQGTAAIGTVVDADLRLIGSQRISVCDASVLPDSPGVNPMVTIMALSLRLSKHLAESKLA